MKIEIHEAIRCLRHTEEESIGQAINRNKNQRESIAQQTEEFLKRGGCIKVHCQGESGYQPIGGPGHKSVEA